MRSIGPKSWVCTFTTFCPQTNTGLWFGITQRARFSESEMRENLLRWDTNRGKGDIGVSIFGFFDGILFSIDFLREVVEMLSDSDRELLEETVYAVIINKDNRSYNCVSNCINYVKCGLVKYWKQLNNVELR